MEINFEEMQVYDFSNLDLQEESDSNCYTFNCDSEYSACDGRECDCHSW